MTALVADPLIGLRGGPGSGPSMGDVGNQAVRPAQQASSPTAVMGSLSGICNEDIRVPDKMVGLSKYKKNKNTTISESL